MCNYARGEGKKLHDPLAMAAVVDESVCRFEEVRVYRDTKGWGSALETGTRTWTSFVQVLECLQERPLYRASNSSKEPARTEGLCRVPS